MEQKILLSAPDRLYTVRLSSAI